MKKQLHFKNESEYKDFIIKEFETKMYKKFEKQHGNNCECGRRVEDFIYSIPYFFDKYFKNHEVNIYVKNKRVTFFCNFYNQLLKNLIESDVSKNEFHFAGKFVGSAQRLEKFNNRLKIYLKEKTLNLIKEPFKYFLEKEISFFYSKSDLTDIITLKVKFNKRIKKGFLYYINSASFEKENEYLKLKFQFYNHVNFTIHFF